MSKNRNLLYSDFLNKFRIKPLQLYLIPVSPLISSEIQIVYFNWGSDPFESGDLRLAESSIFFNHP